MTKTIMLVDDEIQLLSLLSDVLQTEGYKVLTARNGEEALYQARHGKPDLIILDVMMSRMDGYEFMRQHRREHNTPIIMLTAKVDEGDKVLGLQLGADDYITKPFSPRELLVRVQALFLRAGPQISRVETLHVGTVVRVGPNSSFTIPELTEENGGPKTTIELLFGKIFVLLNGGSLNVQTPSGTASVRGSLLSVEYDLENKRAIASCLEGHRALKDKESDETELPEKSGVPLPPPP